MAATSTDSPYWGHACFTNSPCLYFNYCLPFRSPPRRSFEEEPRYPRDDGRDRASNYRREPTPPGVDRHSFDPLPDPTPPPAIRERLGVRGSRDSQTDRGSEQVEGRRGDNKQGKGREPVKKDSSDEESSSEDSSPERELVVQKSSRGRQRSPSPSAKRPREVEKSAQRKQKSSSDEDSDVGDSRQNVKSYSTKVSKQPDYSPSRPKESASRQRSPELKQHSKRRELSEEQSPPHERTVRSSRSKEESEREVTIRQSRDRDAAQKRRMQYSSSPENVIIKASRSFSGSSEEGTRRVVVVRKGSESQKIMKPASSEAEEEEEQRSRKRKVQSESDSEVNTLLFFVH
ncbi:hypothetical protein DPMN_042851 [Dreissena polymorpha]|uniref:Uncharacterized protein n=1 Tax=Dreissena polymorpha TaxID=45954 RepID=A0A9D4CZD3_DREPO|nr:hypothetical protein DPMN_042851 [Dreissena polymorpha]